MIIFFVVFCIIFFGSKIIYYFLGAEYTVWKLRNYRRWGQNFQNTFIGIILFILIGVFSQLFTPGFITTMLFCLEMVIAMLTVIHLFGLS